MTSPKPLRQDVFISYARRDGRETAAWLFEEIKVEGLTAWQDVVALVGGEGWWKQITDAIEGTHTMVLVLTPGAMESNVVRREWAHARRVGTNILPVTRELDFYAKAPRWLGDVHGFILHPDHPDYARSRAAFFEQLRNPPKPRPIPNMAPLLPVEYVSREEQRQAMLDRLVRSVGDGKALEAQLTTLALVGEGGMGKSTLAQAICYEPEIIENYTGGILYAEIGQDAGALTIAINKVLEALNGPVVTSDRLLDQLRHELDGRMCLLVFDDVWDETIIKPYLDIPGQSYLVTTRIASVAALDSRAQPVMIRQMHTNEAAQLLLNYVPEARRPTDGPAKLTPLAQRLGEWALLLDSAGREIRAEMGQGSTLDAAIAWVNDGLHDAGLNDFQAVMDARMSASLRRFTTDEQQRLFELSIFRDDEDVPEVAAVRRWEGTAVMSKREAQKLLRRLAGQFFLRDAAGDAPVIRFHDVLHEYLAGKLGADNSKAAHAALLRSYQALTPSPSPKRGVPLGEGSLEDAANWALLPDDDYLYTHLGYHLLAAGRSDELYTLLTANRDWLDASYRALAGDHGYAADVERLIATYADPLQPDALVQLAALWAARQMVSARAASYTDEDLRIMVLIDLNIEKNGRRTAEALNAARLRANAMARVDGLLAIEKTLRDGGQAREGLLEQVLDIAKNIETSNDRFLAKFEIARALVKLGNPLAHEIFDDLRRLVSDFMDESERHGLLREIDRAQTQAQQFDIADKVADNLLENWQHEKDLFAISSALVKAGQFEAALQTASTIWDDNKREDALSAIASALAQAGQFDAAHQIATSIENLIKRENVLSDIAIALAQAGQFDAALETATTIADYFYHKRAYTLREIAIALAQAGKFETARQIANTIDNDERRADAVSAVAKALAETGEFDVALETTSTIDNDDHRAATLRHIAGILAQAGNPLAIEVFDTIRDNMSSQIANLSYDDVYVWSAKNLSIIVNILEHAGNPLANEIFNATLQKASTIANDWQRANALGDIVNTLAQAGKFEAARQTASTIAADEQRAYALSDIASALARRGNPLANEFFEAARQTASSITDNFGRAYTLKAITNALAQAGEFDAAQQTANTIANDWQRVSALGTIASVLAQAGSPLANEVIDTARQTISTMGDGLESTFASKAIAIAYTQIGQLDAAWQTANTIADDWERANVLNAIASALAEAGQFDAARQTASAITDDGQQATALSAIAGALALAGQFDIALQSSNTIVVDDQRFDALSTIASALAQAGRIDAACQAASTIAEEKQRAPAFREIASALAQIHHYAGSQGAFATLGLREPDEFLEAIADWSPSLEALERGLSVRVLRECVRIMTWVQPAWAEVAGLLGDDNPSPPDPPSASHSGSHTSHTE